MLTPTLTIALLSTALITITLLVSRWGARVIGREHITLPPLSIYGDFPHVPEGFAAGSKRAAGGGGKAKATSRVTRTKDHGSHSMMGRV